MTPDLLLAACAFAFVSSITPGPNNTMLLASGVTHGFVRTVPHLLGVNLGFAFLVLATGLGLGGLFLSVPGAQTALRWIGAAYLLRLAWKIARAAPADVDGASGHPMSFVEAAAFQWVNPKAWIMAIGAIATYLPADAGLPALAVLTLVFAVINAPCVALWAGFGAALRRLFTDPRLARAFNLAMAALLVLSLAPLLVA